MWRENKEYRVCAKNIGLTTKGEQHGVRFRELPKSGKRLIKDVMGNNSWCMFSGKCVRYNKTCS